MNIVLLGAGFSRNWDGWLADEIVGHLFQRFRNDTYLNQLLRETENFEDALAIVQKEYSNNDSQGRLTRFQYGLVNVFEDMNQAIARHYSMEFSPEAEFSIKSFLTRFDAIFTLNQDLLFELLYDIDLRLEKWCAHYFPGMNPLVDWPTIGLSEKLTSIWHPSQTVSLDEKRQPIFKMHGSANWRDDNNHELLVMGGGKQGVISKNRILTWYAEQFKTHLLTPNAKLMVIGYSFSDKHINDQILQASQSNDLGIYLIDPAGRATFRKNSNAQIPVREPLEEINSLGMSTRMLKSTFGGDRLEHQQVMRFFDG